LGLGQCQPEVFFFASQLLTGVRLDDGTDRGRDLTWEWMPLTLFSSS
jgi:hypothetical protein